MEGREMNLLHFAFIPFIPPDLPQQKTGPSWIRRHAPLILSAILCAAKLAGASIPLWLCLLPWMLPDLFVIALIGALALTLVVLACALAVGALYAVVTGREVK
jgi:hypothetical protein